MKDIFKVKVTNSFRLIFKFTLIFASPFFAGPTVFGAKTKQQFFVVKPQDSEVGQGGSVVLPCEVGDRRGRVQWTKDGLTLGKKPTSRCLKITEKVPFNIASEASYVYILSGQKLIKNAKNAPI